jgi:hypothetical protein
LTLALSCWVSLFQYYFLDDFGWGFLTREVAPNITAPETKDIIMGDALTLTNLSTDFSDNSENSTTADAEEGSPRLHLMPKEAHIWCRSVFQKHGWNSKI